jgi:hypothetical protein
MKSNCVFWAIGRRITHGGEIIVEQSPLKATCFRVMHKDESGTVRAFVPVHRQRLFGVFAPWIFTGRVVVIRHE